MDMMDRLPSDLAKKAQKALHDIVEEYGKPAFFVCILAVPGLDADGLVDPDAPTELETLRNLPEDAAKALMVMTMVSPIRATNVMEHGEVARGDEIEH